MKISAIISEYVMQTVIAKETQIYEVHFLHMKKLLLAYPQQTHNGRMV